MNIHLINYATPEYYRSQRLSNESAHSMGGVDRITAYHTSDIDADFYRRNRRILNHPRGGGYWLWKPYFIQRTLAGMKEGDYLFYCDATALFLQPIQLLVDLARTQSLDVLVFDSRFPEWKFSKRDALVVLGSIDVEHFCGRFYAPGRQRAIQGIGKILEAADLVHRHGTAFIAYELVLG